MYILTTSSNMGLLFLGAMRSSLYYVPAAEPSAAGGHGRRITVTPTLFGPALVRRGADTTASGLSVPFGVAPTKRTCGFARRPRIVARTRFYGAAVLCAVITRVAQRCQGTTD